MPKSENKLFNVRHYINETCILHKEWLLPYMYQTSWLVGFVHVTILHVAAYKTLALQCFYSVYTKLKQICIYPVLELILPYF